MKVVYQDELFSTSLFKVVVAKDIVQKEHGHAINDWPMPTYWAMVSSVKCNIKDEDIPKLMVQYNIQELSDFSM